MARPIAGDPPVSPPPAPFQTPPGGMPAPVAPPSPFNYTNQPNMPAPAVQGTPTPQGLWNAFRRRWVLGTFIGGLVAAAVAVGVWMALPGGKHEARALIQLRPKSVSFVSKTQEDFAEYRNRQRFLLKTRDLITSVLKDPAVSSLDSVKQAEDPVAMIEEQLKVTVATDDVLQVTMTGNQLDDMKVIVQHLVQRYIDDTTAFDRRTLEDQIKKHEQYADTLRAEIEGMERQIDLIGRANNTIGGEDNAKRLALLQANLITAESNVSQLTRAIGTLDAQIKVFKDELAKGERFQPDAVLVERFINKDPKVMRTQAAVDAAQAAYNSAFKTSGENKDAPFVVECQTELDKRKKEHEETKKIATAEAIRNARAEDVANLKVKIYGLELDRKIKDEERAKLKEDRDALQKVIAQGVGGGLNIEAMRKALVPQRETLDKISSLVAQLRVERTLDVRVSQRGDVEKVPYTNQNKKIALSSVGGLSALFGVILLVSFLEWRTRRVDGVDQVVTELGMRVIGTVPAFPNRANLKAAVEAGGANWRFVLNESINSTRTMLLHAARTQSMQVVMVTSATQGEGKTSLTSQLATSMATAGMRTLIVDCDLRNPSIQKLFEIPLGPGVSEVLRQEVDVSDAVQATAVPNLWVIPAGQCSNATIAALAQGHPMETLFNRLRGQFDFIIVDSCPVLPVADALLIGQHVDGVVFSIMQDISQLPKVMTASQKMAQLNITLVGAVVNGIKQDVYSYGYNYVKQLPA